MAKFKTLNPFYSHSKGKMIPKDAVIEVTVKEADETNLKAVHPVLKRVKNAKDKNVKNAKNKAIKKSKKKKGK